MAGKLSLIPVERIEHRIASVRGRRVMLDYDLARMYGVTTANLNKAVKRNLARFPADFMFRLTPEESRSLVFQSGIAKPRGRGGRQVPPFVFTEHGVAMLSSVLRSDRAIRVNIAIMRAFARIREMLETHQELAQKLAELEQRIGSHDEAIHEILGAIHELMNPPPERRRKRIGFHVRPKRSR